MQTQNNGNQVKNDTTKKNWTNTERMEQEKKSQQKEDTKTTGNGNEKKSA